MKEHIDQIGLKKEDAIDRVKWHDGVYKLSRNVRKIQLLALTETKLDFRKWISLVSYVLQCLNLN